MFGIKNYKDDQIKNLENYLDISIQQCGTLIELNKTLVKNYEEHLHAIRLYLEKKEGFSDEQIKELALDVY